MPRTMDCQDCHAPTPAAEGHVRSVGFRQVIYCDPCWRVRQEFDILQLVRVEKPLSLSEQTMVDLSNEWHTVEVPEQAESPDGYLTTWQGRLS